MLVYFVYLLVYLLTTESEQCLVCAQYTCTAYKEQNNRKE